MTDVSLVGHVLAGLGAVAAGTVNAVAGGGTLITFPLLTAIGVPAVRANATNTIALCPGYIAGTYAQRADLVGLGPSVRKQAVVAAHGRPDRLGPPGAQQRGRVPHAGALPGAAGDGAAGRPGPLARAG